MALLLLPLLTALGARRLIFCLERIDFIIDYCALRYVQDIDNDHLSAYVKAWCVILFVLICFRVT